MVGSRSPPRWSRLHHGLRERCGHGRFENPGLSDRTGTKIAFKPDGTIFPDIKFQYETLQKQLQELAFLNKGLKIHIVDERSDLKDDYCYQNGLVDFVTYLNRTETALFPKSFP